MRFVFVFCIALLSFFPYPFVFATQDSTYINLQGQIPRAEFESTHFYYGDVYRGQVLSHQFSFHNTGNGTLVLGGIHAACGCTKTKIVGQDGITAQTVFKSTEGGFIQVDFDTSSFSGDVVRTVTIETNIGSSSPTVTLTLNANILQELYAVPALLYVGKIQKNEQRVFSMTLNLNKIATPSAQDFVQKEVSDKITQSEVARPFFHDLLEKDKPFQVFAVESDVPYVKAKIVPVTGENQAHQAQILVTVGGSPIPTGAINAKLTVWNNSTYHKNFLIPIVGEAVGHVQVSAKYVEFGVVSDQKASARVLSLHSSDKNFSVTGVKIDLRRSSEMKGLHNADLFEMKKVKLLKSTAVDDSGVSGTLFGYSLLFKLHYPRSLVLSSRPVATSLGMNVSGSFVVKTNDPDYNEIRIPFFGVLRKEP